MTDQNNDHGFEPQSSIYEEQGPLPEKWEDDLSFSTVEDQASRSMLELIHDQIKEEYDQVREFWAPKESVTGYPVAVRAREIVFGYQVFLDGEWVDTDLSPHEDCKTEDEAINMARVLYASA